MEFFLNFNILIKKGSKGEEEEGGSPKLEKKIINVNSINFPKVDKGLGGRG